MTIFTIWFQNFPNNFVILIAASAISAAFIFIFAKSAMVAEGGRQGWVKRVTGPNAKILFTILFILWALVFGIGAGCFAAKAPALRRTRPDRAVQRLLHHHGPRLERHRRLTAVSAPAPSRALARARRQSRGARPRRRDV